MNNKKIKLRNKSKNDPDIGVGLSKQDFDETRHIYANDLINYMCAFVFDCLTNEYSKKNFPLCNIFSLMLINVVVEQEFLTLPYKLLDEKGIDYIGFQEGLLNNSSTKKGRPRTKKGL